VNRTTHEIRGTAVEEFPESLYDELRRDDERDGKSVQLGGSLYGGTEERDGEPVVRHGRDGFEVIVVERYYFRTNSDLQATVIYEQEASDRASVTVIVGGGKTGIGLLSWDWGSESSQSDTLLSTLEDVCDQLGLSLTPNVA